MSDIINSTSQSIPDSFKEQNIAQEEIKQSLIISENLKKPEQLKKQPLPNFKIKPMIPPDMPLNKQNLEEIEKELSILESLSPKQRSKFSDQLMQKEFMFIDPLIEQKFSQLASISPKELKPLIKQLKENISQLKKTANKLKELDPKKADLILNTLQEISNIETEYTSLKQQKSSLINWKNKQLL